MGILYNFFATILSTLIGCSQILDTMASQVPFSIFSLAGTNYEWKEFEYPHDNEVVIINSHDEFANYIIATNNNNATLPIDFSQYSLILARGVEPYDNRAEISDLQHLPNKDYVMIIKIKSNLATVITNWKIAILTSKIEDGEKVNLLFLK